MKRLDRLTDSAKQRYIVPLDDGGSFTLHLQYMPRVQMWKADIQQGDFILNGILVTSYPNILRQYKNILQFGIMVAVEDGTDPRYQDDFVTGRAKMYVLNADDIAYIEERIFS